MTLTNNFFNSSFYLSQNPDVAAAVDQGLISAEDHFNLYGKFEARSPNPLFDPVFYLAQNPDVAVALEGSNVSAFDHFMAYGFNEARGIHPTINLGDYLAANPDVAAAVAAGEANAFDHLLSYGLGEPRDLGNGVNLGAFANDPVYLEAVANGDLTTAAARVAEVTPFIPSFKAPANWTPPANLPIPTDFVPVEGEKLVIPEGVKVPEGTELPDFIEPAKPTPPVDTGDGETGGGSKPTTETIILDKSIIINPDDIASTIKNLEVTVSEDATTQGLANAVNVGLAGVTGLTSLTSKDSKEKLAFLNVGNQVDLNVKGDHANNVILNYVNDLEHTEQNIKLESANAKNITVQAVEDSVVDVNPTFTTLNLEVSGTSSINRAAVLKGGDIVSDDVTKTVKITGKGGSFTWDSLGKDVESLDAIGYAGDLNIGVLASSLSTVKEFDLGTSGTNTLTIKGNISTETTLKSVKNIDVLVFREEISAKLDVSSLKGNAATLDLTAATITDSVTVKLATLADGNKGDLVDGDRKSDQSVKLPSLENLAGANLTVENMTIAATASYTKTPTANDVLTFNNTDKEGFAEKVSKIEITKGNFMKGESGLEYVNMVLTFGEEDDTAFTLTLNNLVSKNVYNNMLKALDTVNAEDSGLENTLALVTNETKFTEGDLFNTNKFESEPVAIESGNAALVGLVGILTNEGTFVFAEA